MDNNENNNLYESKTNEIPIFFASDDNYVPFLAVSIKSMLENASKEYYYNIYILTEGISDKNKTKLKTYETTNSQISFIELSDYITKIKDRLTSTLRDYYTESIFYRIFIASLCPQYKKAIYLDCDIVVLGDISKFYNIDLGDNILGAVTDDVINGNEDFKIYAKYGVGVDHTKYFNSGVLLMNLDEYRKQKIQQRFVYLLVKHNFETAAPDQDYLNVLCYGKVKYIDKGWDKMSTDENFDGELNLIHYNNFKKPWYYDDVPYGKYFWEYAKKTNYYEDILKIKNSFTQEHHNSKLAGAEKLVEMTKRIVASDKNFYKTLNKQR